MPAKARTTVRSVTRPVDSTTNARGWRYILLVGSVWLLALPAMAQTWVPTDISVLGGAANSQAYAASDSGTVVGTYTTAANSTHTFVWTGGTGWTDPGTLGGTTAVGRAINRAGQVAGYSQLTGNTAYHAFRWSPGGGMVDIGTLGGTQSIAYGINEAGQVVGYSYIAGNTAYHAFLWTAGSGMLDL